jgi:hypothetical protein
MINIQSIILKAMERWRLLLALDISFAESPEALGPWGRGASLKENYTLFCPG